MLQVPWASSQSDMEWQLQAAHMCSSNRPTFAVVTETFNIILRSTFYFTLTLPLCMHSYTFMRIILLPVITSLSIAIKYKRNKLLFYAVMLIFIFEITSDLGTVRNLVLDNNILTFRWVLYCGVNYKADNFLNKCLGSYHNSDFQRLY